MDAKVVSTFGDKFAARFNGYSVIDGIGTVNAATTTANLSYGLLGYVGGRFTRHMLKKAGKTNNWFSFTRGGAGDIANAAVNTDVGDQQAAEPESAPKGE